MAKDLLAQPKDLLARGEESNSLGFVNRGIATTIGAPVDLATGAFNLIPGIDIQQPVGGRESIERLFQAGGIAVPQEGQQPRTTGEFIGQVVGETSGALLPLFKASQIASKGKGILSNVSRQIVQAAVDRPKTAIAVELAGGTGAGLGRQAGQQFDDPSAQIGAELAGGVAGALSPNVVINSALALTTRAGGRILRRLSLPFSEQGAKFRAGEIIKGQVADPEITALKAGGTGAIEGVKLPPVVATGEKRLVSLLKSFRNLDPNVDRDQIERLGISMAKLESEMRNLGFGSPEVMRAVTEKRLASIESRLTQKMTQAIEKADSRLAKLNPSERKSRESVIVRNELKSVMDEEFKGTQKAWQGIDMGESVSFNNMRRKFQKLKDSLSEAEFEDIPIQARNSFMFKEKIASTDTTVLEMNGLRKKMSEVARQSRAIGDFNKARIAGKIEKSIIDELDEQGTAESLKFAIAQTRAFKERFERGITGKILGFSREGGAVIDPSLILDISIGRQGLRGAVDINKVVVTPEARLATQRFLTRSYVDDVTSKGTKAFDPNKAQRWLRNNEEILDQFPELKSSLSDTADAIAISNNINAINAQRLAKLRNPKISVASEFLGSEIEDVVPSLLKGKNQSKRVGEIVNQARKDQTGEALDGLRGGFTDNILRHSEAGFNESGQIMYSGNKMNNFINHYDKALRKVYNPEQMNRLKMVAKELAKIENAQNAKAQSLSVEELDNVSGLMVMGSRIGGAQLGRFVARLTGGGTVQTPGIFSERFKNFATRITKDRAAQLIHDAVTSESPELLQSLLAPVSKPTAKNKQALFRFHRAINAWLLGSGNRVMRDVEEEIAEDNAVLQEQQLGRFQGGS